MALKKGKSKKTFKENVKKAIDEGTPQKQALAVAYSLKRSAEKKDKKSKKGN